MSLIAKIFGLQDTADVSRRSFLKSLVKDCSEDAIILSTFIPTSLYAKDKSAFEIDSIDSIVKLNSLLKEFDSKLSNDEFYQSKSTLSRDLKQIQVNEKIPITFNDFSDYFSIRFKGKDVLVSKGHFQPHVAGYDTLNDKMEVNGLNPLVKLGSLLKGIADVQNSILHETIHYFQDEFSKEDILYDIERDSGIESKYYSKQNGLLLKAVDKGRKRLCSDYK